MKTTPAPELHRGDLVDVIVDGITELGTIRSIDGIHVVVTLTDGTIIARPRWRVHVLERAA